MSDELDVRIKTTLEADEAASASKIKSQIPAIENSLKSRPIKVQVEADTSSTAQNIQTSVKQATNSLKGQKVAIPIDAAFNINLKSSAEIEREVQRLVDKISDNKGKLADFKIETDGMDNARKVILRYKNDAEETVGTVLKLKKTIDKLPDGSISENSYWAIDSNTLAKDLAKLDKQAEKLEKIRRKVEIFRAEVSKNNTIKDQFDFSAIDTALNEGNLRRASAAFAELRDQYTLFNTVNKKDFANHAIENLPKQIDDASRSLNILNDQFSKLQMSGMSVPKETFDRISSLSQEMQTLSANGMDQDALARFNEISFEINKITNEYRIMQSEMSSAKAEEGVKRLATNIQRVQQELLNMTTQWSAFMAKSPDLKAKWQDLFDRAPLIKTQAELTSFRAEMQLLSKEVIGAGLNQKTFWGQFGDNIKKFSSWFFIGGGVASTVREIKAMFGAVKEVDTAMISLRKTTNETEASYSRFLKRAAKTSVDLGSTMSNMIESVADFTRMGYSLPQAEELAKVANIYLNVGDDMTNISQANETIISTLRGMNMDASEAMKLVDILNNVSNKYAVSSGDLGVGLQNSVSALSLAKNDIYQIVAMLTSMSEITQDASESGNALKILSMRLRGMKGELEDIGEEYDNVLPVSKIQTQILDLAGVNIMDSLDPTKFKSTYQIMLEISKVYKDLSETDQAQLLEIIAGKQRGNSISALLMNMSKAEAVLADATNSAGSAMKEQDQWMNSIEAKQQRLTAQFQEFSTTVLNSGLIKGAVDAGSGLLGTVTSIVESLNTIPTLAGVAMAALAFKNKGIVQKTEAGNFNWAWNVPKSNVEYDVSGLTKYLGLLDEGNTKEEAFAKSMLNTSSAAQELTKQQNFGADAIKAFQTQQMAAIKTGGTFGRIITSLGSALKTAFMSFAQMAAVMAIAKGIEMLVTGISNYINRVQILSERMNELQDAHKKATDEVKSIQDELKETSTLIDSLQTKGPLTIIEQDQLETLKEAKDVLELMERIAKGEANKTANELAEAAKNLYATSYASQPTTEEEIQKSISIYKRVGADKTSKTAPALDSDTVSEQMFIRRNAYEKINELKNKDIVDEQTKNDIEYWQGQLSKADASLNEHLKKLVNLRKNIAPLDMDGSIERQVSSMIDLIDKELNPAEFLTSRFNEVFDSDIFKASKDSLVELAAQGKLTSDVLSKPRYAAFIDALKEIGISADEATAEINAMYQAVEDPNSPQPGSYDSFVNRYQRMDESQSQAQEALKSEGSISVDTYDKLIEANSMYASALDASTGYIKLNADAIRELDEAQQNELLSDIATAKAKKVVEYKDLSKEIKTNALLLKKLTDATEDDLKAMGLSADTRDKYISTLQEESDTLKFKQSSIRQEIQDFERLSSQIMYATSAYKKWLDVQDVPESGDMYRGLKDALDALEEGLETGATNTEKYKAALNLLVPENERDNVKNYFDQLKKYITEDEDGLEKYYNDLIKKGILKKMKDGTVEWTDEFSVSDIAEKTNKTDDYTYAALLGLEEHGLNVDFISGYTEATSAVTQLEEATSSLADAEEKLASLKKDPSATQEDIVAAVQAVQSAKEAQSEAQNAVDTLNEPELTLAEQLQTEIALVQSALLEVEALKIPGNLDVNLQTDLSTLQGLLNSLDEASQLSAKCKVNADPQPLIDALGALEEPNEGEPNYSVKMQVYMEKSELYTSTLGEITTDREETGKPLTYKVTGDGLTDTKTKIAQLKTTIETLNNLKENGVISEEIHASLTGDYDTKLSALEDRLAEIEVVEIKVTGGQEVYKGNGPFDTDEWNNIKIGIASDDAETVLENFESLLKKLYGKNLGDFGISEDTLPSLESMTLIISDLENNKTPSLSAAVDDLSDKNVGDLGLNETKNSIDIVQIALDNINNTVLKDKTFNVVQQNTSVSSGGGGESAFASGTKNAKGGKSLVSEVEPETVVRMDSGTYEVYSKPTFVDLNPGDMVLNGRETRNANHHEPEKRGRSFASGGIFGSFIDTIKSKLKAFSVGTSKVTFGSTKNSSKKKSSGNGGRSSSSSSKPSDLWDWIEVKLENLKETTENFIYSAEKAIGHIAKNLNIDKALQSVQSERSSSELAYSKYIAQADAVAKKYKLSSDIINKVQNGSIDITSYSESVRSQIQDYQNWYKKAQDVRSTIRDLNDQVEELAGQRLTNITEDFDYLINRYDQQVSISKLKIDQKTANGKEIVASDYAAALESTTKKISTLTEQRYALTKEFESLVLSGAIQKDSNLWREHTTQMSELDDAIIQTGIDLRELKDSVSQITITNLEYSLSTLQRSQEAIESIISLRETQGNSQSEGSYSDLVRLGSQQIDNLQKQNQELSKQLIGLDSVSEKYQEIKEKISDNEKAIWDIKNAQEEWNDAALDIQIDALQKQRDELEKTNDAYKRHLALQEAIEAVERARQRTQLVYREGVGFVREADQKALQDAQNSLDDLRHEELINTIEDAIEAIEKQKTSENIYDANGNKIQKFANGGVDSTGGLKLMHGTPSSVETTFNATDGKKLYDLIHNSVNLSDIISENIMKDVSRNINYAMPTSQISMPSFTIESLHLHEVNNTDDLAKAIVTTLPNKFVQELYKHI